METTPMNFHQCNGLFRDLYNYKKCAFINFLLAGHLIKLSDLFQGHGEGTQWVKTESTLESVHRRALNEHLWVQFLAQVYLNTPHSSSSL